MDDEATGSGYWLWFIDCSTESGEKCEAQLVQRLVRPQYIYYWTELVWMDIWLYPSLRIFNFIILSRNLSTYIFSLLSVQELSN